MTVAALGCAAEATDEPAADLGKGDSAGSTFTTYRVEASGQITRSLIAQDARFAFSFDLQDQQRGLIRELRNIRFEADLGAGTLPALQPARVDVEYPRETKLGWTQDGQGSSAGTLDLYAFAHGADVGRIPNTIFADWQDGLILQLTLHCRRGGDRAAIDPMLTSCRLGLVVPGFYDETALEVPLYRIVADDPAAVVVTRLAR